MGLAYKIFQSITYSSLEKARKKGLEVNRQWEKERRDKRYQEVKEVINYDTLDREWEELMIDCWDNRE